MYYNVFLELFGLLSTNTMHLYSEGPKKNGRYYEQHKNSTLWILINFIVFT